MVVSAKNVILNTTLDLRAGMDTLKIHLPEKYLKGENDKLYVKILDVVNSDQFFSKEYTNVTNPIEITLSKNLSSYTGDVYIVFSTLPEFKFYFTVKNEKSTVYPKKTSKSFYPSDTVFINRTPVVELTEIFVDEIKENAKADAKTVINLEEIRKGLFANSDGKYLNYANGIDGIGDGTSSRSADMETTIQYYFFRDLFNNEPDGLFQSIFDNNRMIGSNADYKNPSKKSENVTFYDYLTYKLTEKYQGFYNNIEDDLLSKVCKRQDELVRVVKLLAASANIEHKLDNPFEE
jgi:hypothetical protein